MENSSILIINSGSSTLKFEVFKEENLESIQSRQFVFEATGGMDEAFAAMKRELGTVQIRAVGHRIVHGGEEFSAPVVLTDEVCGTLKAFSSLAPEHQPLELDLVTLAQKQWPDAVHVGCFDTAFHASMPERAKTVSGPSGLMQELQIKRYGFHGTSYQYLMTQLENPGRTILCHLGNGSSMAAVKDGKCIDTTMGFSPTSGLVMGTRSGDIDPAVSWFLQKEKGMSSDEVYQLLNKESGLLGISGISSDMQELLASDDPKAKLAIEIFCYRAKKYIGSLAAALGGLDTLVFSGGIGEHSPEIRTKICEGLEFLGIRVDASSNAQNAQRISSENSQVNVLVIPTNEQLQIAKETRNLL